MYTSPQSNNIHTSWLLHLTYQSWLEMADFMQKPLSNPFNLRWISLLTHICIALAHWPLLSNHSINCQQAVLQSVCPLPWPNKRNCPTAFGNIMCTLLSVYSYLFPVKTSGNRKHLICYWVIRYTNQLFDEYRLTIMVQRINCPHNGVNQFENLSVPKYILINQFFVGTYLLIWDVFNNMNSQYQLSSII